MMGRFFGLALGVVATVALVAGCPEEKKTTPTKKGTVVITAVDENNQPTTAVLADGTDFALLQLQAKDPDGAAWVGEVDLTTDRGAFEATAYLNNLKITTDSNGQAAVRFLCINPDTGDPVQAGLASISARNSLASARLSISCDSFNAGWALRLQSPSGTAFHANGFTEVPLVATALGLHGQGEPLAAVRFEVVDTSKRLCTVDNSPCVASSLSAALVVETDSNGLARVLVQAPSSPAAVSVTATWTYDAAVAPKTSTINLNFAEDQSGIELTSFRTTVPANGTATVALTATASNFDGTPMAAGTNVTFVVGAPYAVGSPAAVSTVVAVTGNLGQATTLLNASTIVGTAVVSASFNIAPGQVRSSEPSYIEFAQAGRLLLATEAVPTEFYSDDLAFSVVTVTAERDGTIIGNQQVTFALNDSDLALAYLNIPGVTGSQQERTLTTDTQGQASVEVRGQFRGSAGTISVDVTTFDAQNNRDESTTQRVMLKRHPILQSVVFVGASPAVLGTRGSPRPSTAVVTFMASDDNNVPMAGVEFRFPRPITIDPTVTITTIGGGDTTQSDAAGEVIAYLSAGAQAHPVRVIAEATDPRTGVTLTVVSDSIPITSGLTSFTHSWFVCDQSARTLRPPATRTCAMELADRFSERVPEGTNVQFRVESGNITPSVATSDDGNASGVNFLTGSPPPSDTRDVSGNLGTANPKDMLVGMLAYTRGEEPFTDLDGNGLYDDGEPFVDFPEPFLDKHDNCVRNDATKPLDEFYVDPTLYPNGVADPYLVLLYTDQFVDGNNDGVWNGPNQTWDADTLLWFQEFTVYVFPAASWEVIDLNCVSGGNASRCPTGGPHAPWTGAHLPWIAQGEIIPLTFRAFDGYGNCPAPGESASYSVSVTNGAVVGGASIKADSYGCGTGTGHYAIDPVTDYIQPFCSVFGNLEIDSNLSIVADGLGSHPYTRMIDTVDSVIGDPIRVSIRHSGDGNNEAFAITYVIPCHNDQDCGAPTPTDGGVVATGPTCTLSTGLCFRP